MATDVFTNNAVTGLSAAISTTPAAGTSETWSVYTTGSFPAIGTGGTQQFRVTVGPTSDTSPEIVIVTAINSSTSVTVTRGAEGSPIKTHAVGDPFAHTVTAGALVNSYAPVQQPATAVSMRPYDTRTNIAGLTPSNFQKSRAKRDLAKTGQGNWKICCGPGDSLMASFIPPTNPTNGRSTLSWPARVAQLFVAAGYTLNDGATLVDAQDTDDHFTSTGSGWSWHSGGDGCFFYTQTSGNTLTFTGERSVAAGSLEFAYLDSTGTFTYAVDGGTVQTVTMGGTNNIIKVTATTTTTANHSIVFTCGASSLLSIMWVDVYTTGCIRLMNFGVYGSAATETGLNWNYQGVSYSALNVILSYAADTYITQLAGNDFLEGVTTIANFVSTYQTIITTIQGIGGQVVYMAEEQITDSSGNLEPTTWHQAHYTIAESLSLPLLDIWDRFISTAAANAVGWQGPDTEISPSSIVHNTIAGYNEVATAVFNLLMS